MGIIRPESTNAYIKMIPKQGKDPLNPSSYRPISLIDLDQKLLTKIMADRLSLLLPSLIVSSQKGFVRGQSAVGNIRKVGILCCWCSMLRKPSTARAGTGWGWFGTGWGSRVNSEHCWGGGGGCTVIPQPRFVPTASCLFCSNFARALDRGSRCHPCVLTLPSSP